MRRILPLLALALAPLPARAQPRYLPQPDTLYYEALNPYHMYVVRGADTLGGPVRALSVERQVWRAEGEGLTARLHDERIGGGEPRTYVLQVNPRGVVTAISQGAVDGQGRWDLVLSLPAAGGLEEGRTWADTLDVAHPQGRNAYQVWRELRVERIADTLGSRMAIVRGTGTVRYRDTYPLQEGEWWLDVRGPVRETFLFDLRNGRLAAREWWMDLRGRAGLPASGGAVDTLPAGLFSADTTRLVTAQRARLLLRGLPPGDTTATTGDADFLHTVRARGDTLESGFVRPDGMLTTVRAIDGDAGTREYEMLATKALAEPVRRTIRLENGMLRVRGGADTAVALPELPWTVADYGMHEHLGRALVRLARQEKWESRLAVFRPYPLRWDTLQVRLAPVAEGVLLASLAAGNVQEVLLLREDGTLLYVERAEPGATQRRPRPGTAQARTLDALIEKLMEQGGAKP